jgi:hypothetical protein
MKVIRNEDIIAQISISESSDEYSVYQQISHIDQDKMSKMKQLLDEVNRIINVNGLTFHSFESFGHKDDHLDP